MTHSKVMCYTGRDAADRFCSPTVRRFNLGSDHSPYYNIFTVMGTAASRAHSASLPKLLK